MNCYAANRTWSDRFLPEIKTIVGARLLQTAPDAIDWNQATDLLMLDGKDLRIAARVRRYGYASQYPYIRIRRELNLGLTMHCLAMREFHLPQTNSLDLLVRRLARCECSKQRHMRIHVERGK